MGEREGITSGVKVQGSKGLRGIRLNEPAPVKDERAVLRIVNVDRPSRSGGAKAAVNEIEIKAAQKAKSGEAPRAPFSPRG
jgi:hypothetical protein